MKIAVIDDNQQDKKVLIDFLRRAAHTLHWEIQICSYACGEMFLAQEDLSALDAVFLDIYMEKSNGLQVAKAMREDNYSGVIIFCTVTPDFALEGYSVNALNYIVKPFTYEVIEAQVKQIDQFLNTSAPYILIKEGRQWCKIHLQDILYLEKHANYTCIHTIERLYSTRMTLGAMEKELASYRCFVKCDRGIVINLHNVQGLQRNTILMRNGEKLPISYSNLAAVNNAYFDFLVEQFV